MRQVSLTLICLLAMGFWGCGRQRSGAGPGLRGELRVVYPYVARWPMEAVNKAFRDAHPGVGVVGRPVMVDDVTKSMEAGNGEGDIYVMMGGPEMSLAGKGGRVEASRKVVWATSPVVLVTPKDNPKKVMSCDDLLQDRIRKIVIPDPERDSAGAAFVQALKRAGRWEAVSAKVAYASSPHTACTEAEEGKADVAVTYGPCVSSGHSQCSVSLAAFLPEESYEHVAMVAAPFADAKSLIVDEYLDYLLSPEAQVLVGQAGFEPARPADRGSAKVSLDVPCGAGLQPAMDDLGNRYFQRTGVRVDFSYAGAGMLLSGLMTMRRGDLYVPGEAFYVDQARKHGFVAEDKPMCYMTPVLAVRKGNPANVTRLQDLARPGLRVAIGDPEAIAIGPMTERILKRADIFEAVERNVTIKGACVPELANALATHSADAGIIWDVMAVQNAKDVDAFPIDPKYNEASEVLVSRLTCSKHPEEARKFVAFLTSDEAAAIFHKYGYGTERPAGIRLAPREKIGGKQQAAKAGTQPSGSP
jgi:molybdate transport system substrate-binding protein